MKFQLVNNHLILKVDTDLGEKTCVYDTGSLLSFFSIRFTSTFLTVWHSMLATILL